MSVPSVWPFVLLVMSAYRSWRLLAVDEVGDRPRNWLLDRTPWLQHWLECPWCAGAYSAVAWWCAYEWSPHVSLVVATPFALSLVVGLVARNLDP